MLQHLLNKFKQNVLPMFFRIPMITRIKDELYQTEVDLLNADHNAEHWTMQAHMLRGRRERLREMVTEYAVD